MKRLVMTLAMVLAVYAAAPTFSEPPDHIQYVQALRAKGYSDLALDYLDKLAKIAPKDLAAVIPLEKARVRMDMATLEPRLATRTSLYKEARKEFLAFVKAKAGDPLAAEAQLEAARILAMEGRSLMKQSRRLPAGEELGPVNKAYDLFLQAERELGEAKTTLEKAAAAPNTPRSVAAAFLQSQLEQSLVQLDLASTYEPRNKSLKDRADIVTKAITNLKLFANANGKEPAGQAARAWITKGYLEIDDPNTAKKEIDAILKEPDSKDTELAKRLTRYFEYHLSLHPGYAKTKEAQSPQKLAENWVASYPNHSATPEGISLRYDLAVGYKKQAVAQHKPPTAPPSPVVKDLYLKAQKMYQSLEEPETEYTEEARAENLQIEIILASGVGGEFKTAKEGFLASKAQAIKMAEAETKYYQERRNPKLTPAEKEALDKKWPVDQKAFLNTIRETLLKAIALADAQTPAADIAEARSNLAYVYMALGDPEKAAIIGEHVAHQYSHTAKAASGAAFAIQAYGQMIHDSAGVLEDKWVKTDEDRLLKLARFMEKTWPKDPNTDAARHQVGTLLLKQKRAKDAVDVLSKVSDGYQPAASLTDARWWYAVAAQQMANEKEVTEKEKTIYLDHMRRALEGIPEVANNVSGDTAHIYIMAKIQLGQALFDSKRYNEMEQLAANLQARLAGFKNLPDATREELRPTVDAITSYAALGRANTLLVAGQPAKAGDLIDPLIGKVTEQLKKAKAAAVATKDDAEKSGAAARLVTREAELLRALLSVALRAKIQEGNIARSIQLLTILRDASSDTVGAQVYVQVVASIKKQIDELKAAGKKKQLDELIGNFAAFLDALGKQSKLPPELIFFVANAYDQLDKQVQAAALLEQIKNPGEKAAGFDTYRAAALLRVQLLRRGKDFKKAGELLDVIEKEAGLKDSLPVMRERANFYRDQKKFGGAAVSYRNIMERIGTKTTEPRLKEQYFDAYFNYIECLYLYSLDFTDPKLTPAEVEKKKLDYIKRAAVLIVKVEGQEGYDKEKYDALLKSNPALKKAYDEAKKEAALEKQPDKKP